MIDDVKIKEAFYKWQRTIPYNTNLKKIDQFYGAYIELFLSSYMQKVDLYNIYINNEDCIWIYPLRTLYEMLLKFEYFIKQDKNTRIKISHLDLYKYTTNKKLISDLDEYNIHLEDFCSKFSKKERKEILYPRYDILSKNSDIFTSRSYELYKMFCGFTHGEVFYTQIKNYINSKDESRKDIEYALSEGIISCLNKIK
jgi:hypothetical protein